MGVADIEHGRNRHSASEILRAWELGPEQKNSLLDNRESVIAVLSIHESLRVIFSEAGEDRAYQWVSKPNKAFEGSSAVEIILAGDIERVRKYLKYHIYNA
jgi:hypothetical protein